MQDGKVLYKHQVNSHDILLWLHGVKDDTDDRNKMLFARVEITPPDGDLSKPLRQWEFKIDERIKPSWWTSRHKKACWNALKEYMQTYVRIGKTIEELYGDNLLALIDCKVKRVTYSTISMLQRCKVESLDRSYIAGLYDSEIEFVGESSIRTMGESKCKTIYGSTLDVIERCKIVVFGTNSTVRSVRSSEINRVRTSFISILYNSTVESIEGTSRIGSIDQSFVGSIEAEAIIGHVCGMSRIEESKSRMAINVSNGVRIDKLTPSSRFFNIDQDKLFCGSVGMKKWSVKA